MGARAGPRRSGTLADRSGAWGRARRKGPQSAREAWRAGEASCAGTRLAARGKEGAGRARRAGRGGAARGGESGLGAAPGSLAQAQVARAAAEEALSPRCRGLPRLGITGASARLPVFRRSGAVRGNGAWARGRPFQGGKGRHPRTGWRDPLAEDGWRERAPRITSLLSLWRGLPGVRKSSPRSLGRPRRLRGGGDGGGGAAAGSASGAAAARRPAGARRSPRPGGTRGSCPGKPRPRCWGWNPSCPRRCRRCPDLRHPPSAAGR